MEIMFFFFSFLFRRQPNYSSQFLYGSSPLLFSLLKPFANYYLMRALAWTRFGSATLLLLPDLVSVICNVNATEADAPSQSVDLLIKPPGFSLMCNVITFGCPLDGGATYADVPSRHKTVCFGCINPICWLPLWDAAATANYPDSLHLF